MKTHSVRSVLTALGLLLAASAWAEVRSAQPMAAAHAGPAGPVARGVIWRVRTDEKVVALTFDDGPDPKYTPKLLELARAKGVKFTFFLVGKNVRSYPDLARQEVNEGHAVGNHTWDHRLMTKLTARQARSEIARCEKELDRVCGPVPRVMRPPKGKWDEGTARAARTLGYPVILWSLELEHHPRRSAERLAQRAIGLVRPGAIILAHDGQVDRRTDRSKTLQALPLVIDGLQRKGYRFVTVPELLAMEKPRGGSASPAPAP